MNEAKFSGKGEIYSQYRPSYPLQLLDYLYGEAGFSEDSIIADIGSGTGKLTRCLLERKSKVYAVEPSDDMRKEAESSLFGFKNFISINGSAENTNLPGGSVNFVTAAQAFHWFDRQKFRTECRRILKKNGRAVLIWNSRDEESELVLRLAKISRECCPGFKGFSGGMHSGEAAEGFFGAQCDVKIINNPLVFDEEGFIGRCLSSSYAPGEGEKNYNSYVNALKLLFSEYSENGKIVMPNKTFAFVGTI